MKKILVAALAAFAASGVMMPSAIVAPAYAAECDLKKGKKIFKRCKACHKLEEGKNGIGPSLHQILNRPVASVGDFEYSAAMTAYAEGDAIWDLERLDRFIAKPKKEIKGTKMQFAGLKKDKQRSDLFCYLEKEAGATGG